MNEMIERVARAMCTADGHNPDADSREHASGAMWDVAELTPEWWRHYGKKAVAVIKEMREPTEELKKNLVQAILEAGIESRIEKDGWSLAQTRHPAAAVWRAIIDTLLK